MMYTKGNYFIRREKNGITILYKSKHLYRFYQNVSLDEIINMSIKELENYFKNRKSNKNIIFEHPFKVSWLIEEKCNLDCIYCIAHNKMYKDLKLCGLADTAAHIIKLKIMNVCISGGEPFLSSGLSQIIAILSRKCAITIDTNGTICILKDMLEILKKANVLIRISVDSLNKDIVNKVRPAKNKYTGKYLRNIIENIKILTENNIDVMIHTVITNINKDDLVMLGEKLIELGITRWHLFEVIRSSKCEPIYNEIKVASPDLIEIKERLLKKFGDRMDITFDFDKMKSNSKVVLLIDNQGRFFLDTFVDGIKFIGEIPEKPSIEEINEKLDILGHCNEYLLS